MLKIYTLYCDKYQNSPFCIIYHTSWKRGGGTDLERGYGDVRPWRPPFHASPAARKGPISSKRVSSQDSLLRKFGNFSLYSLNFHPNFSSQAPKFGNFPLTSPQICKFSAHKPPNVEIFSSQAPEFGNFPLTSPPFQRQMSVRKPHTSEIRAAHPYLKKSCGPPPPPGRAQNWVQPKQAYWVWYAWHICTHRCVWMIWITPIFLLSKALQF